MRVAREHHESLRGDYSVDFAKIWQKAKVKCQITTKQPVYLTHLRDERQISLKQEEVFVNPKETKQ